VAVRLDVARDQDFLAARDLALATFGRIDIVMNNVGAISAGLPHLIPVSEWQRALDLNLLSMVRSNSTFLPLMLERGSGHVVNTASTAGLYPYAFDRSPYAAAKAAVVSLSESLSLYLAAHGIGVTCVCPGPINTNIRESIRFTGEPIELRGQGLEPLDASSVGTMVVDAVRHNRFLVLTHPEVRSLLVDRARDHDAFIRRQERRFERHG
jgi:NAD(P)-dependent dehydrogenase (short-subunit alcohol dehydrogenase family)